MRSRWFRVFAAVAFAAQPLFGAGGATPVGAAPADAPAAAPLAAPAAAANSTLRINVVASRSATGGPNGNVTKGQAVTSYKWLINKDDSGDSSQAASFCDPTTNPAYGLYGFPVSAPITTPPPPAGSTTCNWPSVHPVLGGTSQGALTQGDNTLLNGSTGISLPNGKYLISVLATGYKLGGQLFSLPVTDPSGVVTVQLQPMPLPSSTIRAKVFNDVLTNGEFDEPGDLPLQGFHAHLYDAWGNEVTVDIFGNGLCTTYQTDSNGNVILTGGKPTVTQIGGKCLSNADGDVVIPNMPEDKYSLVVIPPDGSQTCSPSGPPVIGCWVQTSTLEGGHDWDTWQINGDTGYTPERTIGNELVPEVISGWVTPTWLPGHADTPTNGSMSDTGAIKGVVLGLAGYSPPAGGLAFGGEAGNKVTGPIANPWIFLASRQLSDLNVFVSQGNPDGTFQINHIPDGDYIFGAFDGEQNMLMEAGDVTVSNGQLTDMGVFYVLHWFGTLEGRVCVDQNGNGKCDPGEPGAPNLVLNILGRDNTLFDGGTVAATTDTNGHYLFRQAYPPGQWYIEQGYFEHYKTVGVTYQTDNMPQEVTTLGTGVDVNVLSMVGGHARIDWAVTPYAPGTNGGIVGEMVYNTARFSPDPRLIQVTQQPMEAGIAGIPVNLYAPISCPNPIPAGVKCETAPDGVSYQLAADGSYAKGQFMNVYTSENWQRPNTANTAAEVCTDRDSLGNAQGNTPPRTPPGSPPQTPYGFEPTASNTDCLESFAANLQVMTNFGSPSGNSTVNGNYGFTAACLPGGPTPCDPTNPADPNKQALPPGDYIVEPQIPNDPVFNKPIYVPTAEEDVNIFNVTQVTPQLPPMPCSGPLHKVHVTNPDYLANGGSPYEGQMRHLCGDKLVAVASQRSVTPNFYWHTATDVPLPGRFHGLITDDLNLSSNSKEINYGEKAGIPNIPVGIYDYSNRLITTVHTDPNGEFDVILPSSWQTNCLNPTSACPTVYHMVSNDPGQPGAANPDYNLAYRTLTANFQLWPNNVNYADMAPVPIHLSIEGPGTQFSHPAACKLDTTQPQLFAVSVPYVRGSGNVTISGVGFGTQSGASHVTLNQSVLPISSWSDTQIVVSVPSSMAPGPYQLAVTNSTGNSTINGLTFHVLGTGYNPTVYEVGPGKTYATVQRGIEAASHTAQALVVVYPGTPGSGSTSNPLGSYYENIVIHSPIKLQGVGPGGVRDDGSSVPGSILDGFGFENRTDYSTAWRALVAGLTWSGNQNVDEGQVVYVLSTDGQWTSGFQAAIDGLTIQGGDQLTFPSNINDNGGVPIPISERQATEIVAQGGGIYVNAFARNLQITNNVIQGNGGSYGGAIRVGSVGIGDNHNDNLRIANNRVVSNGGHNLAGALGLFAGTNGYEVAFNDICGNFASEYGGGISHFGLSPNSAIHDNKIYFNGAYDHGGAIIVSGEPPANPASQLSTGTGAVNIYNNLVQGNVSNDDGGGIALESVETYPIAVFNNMLVNNIATHEGGAIAMDDAPYVTFDSNTVMQNITTGTSAHGTGAVEPAGLSTVRNSVLLQAALPAGSPLISEPTQFNNIFWNNRAGAFILAAGAQTYTGITGIGLAGDPNPVNYWDMGVADNSGDLLHPTNSVLQQTNSPYIQSDPSNVSADPQVKSVFTTSVTALPWRGDPHFVGVIEIAVDVPAIRAGDYHLSGPSSPAFHLGAASKNGVNAPAFDIDYDARPSGSPPGWEAGADQLVTGNVEPEPEDPVVENFNRANGSVGANWRGNTGTGFFRILSNALDILNSGFMLWGPTATPSGVFGGRQEAFFTFTKVAPAAAGATDQDLLLKVSGPVSGTTSPGTSLIEIQYDSTQHAVFVNTFDGAAGGAGWVTQATVANQTFQAGDVFGAKTYQDGSVDVYKNGFRISSVNIGAGPNPWPASYISGGGRIGVWFIASHGFSGTNDARIDDFGGGNLP